MLSSINLIQWRILRGGPPFYWVKTEKITEGRKAATVILLLPSSGLPVDHGLLIIQESYPTN